MRFGLCVANIGSYSDPGATIRVARAAEAAGWDALFVWDHLAFAWGQPAADPWVVLAAVAAATERLRIGTMVTPVARRRPHVLAQTVATLDVLSGGRVIFGAGLGGAVSEFERFGEASDPKVRAEKLDEGLDLLRRLWSGEELHHRGAHYTIDGVKLAPLPVQDRLPVWIGGNRGPSLRRAARWDGWIADDTSLGGRTLSPADLRDRIGRILAGRESVEPFDVAILSESDRRYPAGYERAGATWWLENIFDRRGPPEQMLELVEAGPAA
jgi:alkanesulfonate monooxygenase SsuD/methylene tetrahydromethanopterin reductase-like flavin-dependent oxidoreductase (luciferase family)